MKTISTGHKPTEDALESLRTSVVMGSAHDMTQDEAFLVWEHIAAREFAWQALLAQQNADGKRQTAMNRNRPWPST